MRDVRRLWRHWLGGLVLVWLYFSLAQALCDAGGCGIGSLRAINFFGQAFLLVNCARLILRSARLDPSYIWTPVVIYPLSTALYFGFGNMLFIFGNDAFLSTFMEHRYYITQAQLVRANLLTVTGILVASVAFYLFLRVRYTVRSEQIVFREPRLSIPATALALLMIGLGIMFAGIVLRLVQGGDARLPGILVNLSRTVDLGLALALYLGIKGRRSWLLLFWILWIPYVGYTLLEFSKKALLFSILLPAAAAYLAHGSVKRILPFVILAGTSFAFIQDVNSEGRVNLRSSLEAGSGNTVLDRMEILLDALSSRQLGASAEVARDVSQVWWQRLTYAGPQTRAMELYDAGRPTEWQVNPLVYVIPRAVWPDKPTMPALGRDFNRIISGLDYQNTRVGITIYANGYWMLGWPGVVLFSAVYGVILAGIARINMAIVSQRNFIFLPAVFSGLSVSALSQMAYFETSVLGGVSVYVGLLFAIRYGLIFGRQIMGSRRYRRLPS
ncbi:MAG TPA: hypothetical protein PKD10_00925 [Paracoccaceae bacterium]|nr:hypothetical protein [Paracoccaceae bacterium]HMO71083.1 hypothetical protein [Paracoccaceae bacterium]